MENNSPRVMDLLTSYLKLAIALFIISNMCPMGMDAKD